MSKAFEQVLDEFAASDLCHVEVDGVTVAVTERKEVAFRRLPVGSGYSVTVDLAANDTYTVRRVFKRGAKVWVKGEQTEVYCDEVGEIAYQASSFRSYDFPKTGGA